MERRGGADIDDLDLRVGDQLLSGGVRGDAGEIDLLVLVVAEIELAGGPFARALARITRGDRGDARAWRFAPAAKMEASDGSEADEPDVDHWELFDASGRSGRGGGFLPGFLRFLQLGVIEAERLEDSDGHEFIPLGIHVHAVGREHL